MQLGGKVPAKEHKKICQMVTTTIWHRIDLRSTLYGAALKGAVVRKREFALMWRSCAI